jgi:hypothetical protein
MDSKRRRDTRKAERASQCREETAVGKGKKRRSRQAGRRNGKGRLRKRKQRKNDPTQTHDNVMLCNGRGRQKARRWSHLWSQCSKLVLVVCEEKIQTRQEGRREGRRSREGSDGIPKQRRRRRRRRLSDGRSHPKSGQQTGKSDGTSGRVPVLGANEQTGGSFWLGFFVFVFGWQSEAVAKAARPFWPLFPFHHPMRCVMPFWLGLGSSLGRGMPHASSILSSILSGSGSNKKGPT